MDWNDLFTALALVFVIEGVLPVLAPKRYREMMSSALQQPDHVLRMIGLASMVSGVLILIWLR